MAIQAKIGGAQGHGGQMCYSARIWADYRKYVKEYGASISIKEFVELFELRLQGVNISIPKEVTDPFKDNPQTDEERHCRDLIVAYEAQQAQRLQEELFHQRRRLADAERALETKPTKKAAEVKRIASNKIAAMVAKMDELDRVAPQGRDARIYPGSYCPVLVMDSSGQYKILPMRYQCRPASKPAFYDKQYPGTYNARRDNLQGFWKPLYGKTHAVIVATAFYENVKKHRLEHRELAKGEAEENVVLQFAPEGGRPMQIACLWSRWTKPGEDDLISFAAITDEPPPEVSEAGHDRCVVPIKRDNLAKWLAAPSLSLTDHEAILEDREALYYEHLLLAA
jgi:putative SOS response-associated peptidase YedK